MVRNIGSSVYVEMDQTTIFSVTVMYYIWFMLKRCKVGILTKKECKHRKFGKWKTKALVFGTSDLWLTYFAREFGFNDLKGKKIRVSENLHLTRVRPYGGYISAKLWEKSREYQFWFEFARFSTYLRFDVSCGASFTKTVLWFRPTYVIVATLMQS